jgi:hypothetical protein
MEKNGQQQKVGNEGEKAKRSSRKRTRRDCSVSSVSKMAEGPCLGVRSRLKNEKTERFLRKPAVFEKTRWFFISTYFTLC